MELQWDLDQVQVPIQALKSLDRNNSPTEWQQRAAEPTAFDWDLA
jgi:hypothetical protein